MICVIKHKRRLALVGKKTTWGLFRYAIKYSVRSGYMKERRWLQLARAYKMCCKDNEKLNYFDFYYRLLNIAKGFLEVYGGI